MPAKVCPRCGALYPTLKSATCPQCFATLVEVDEATAQEMAAARAAVEQTPEFQEAKAADDERWREQTFGACLGVVAIAIVTLVVAVVLLVAARRHPRPVGRMTFAGQKGAASSAPAPALPLPGAGWGALDRALPPAVGPFVRTARDADVALPGTLTPVYHAAYRRPGPDRATLDVWAIPNSRPTAEQNEFRLGVALAADVGTPRPLTFFATRDWLYAAAGPPGMGGPVSPDAFRAALGSASQEQPL